MLKELKISNFRVFSDPVTVRFRPITVLIGRNNAGKTSVIKFLLMLQQSLRRHSSDFFVLEGEKVKIGSFDGLKNSSSKKRYLNFSLNTESFQDFSRIEKFIKYADSIVKKQSDKIIQQNLSDIQHHADAQEGFRALFEIIANVPYGEIQNGDQKIIAKSSSGFETHIEQKFERRDSASFLKFTDLMDSLEKDGGIKDFVGKLFNLVDFNDKPISQFSVENWQLIKNMYTEIYLMCTQVDIDMLTHILPLRAYLDRVVGLSSSPKNFVGQDGRFAIPHLHDLWETDSKEKNIVKKYLKDVAGVENLKFLKSGRVANYLRAEATNAKTKAKTPLLEFGFGVSQVMPILTQGVIQHPHTHLMVEEPEAQLHPTAQLELGSFFADIWNKRRVGSIIETHSDNILLRLRRLIARGDLQPDDVSVAFFDLKGKKPTVKNLNIESDGSMEDGLPMEFFHSDIREALSMDAGK